jgi:uncharacterized membrane protein
MDETIDLPVLYASRNVVTPLERWALRFALFFTLGGGIVAAYLVTLHAAIAGNPKRGLCTFTDTVSCDKVLASPYAEVAGVPVALIGLLGFGVLFALAAWRLLAGERSPRWVPAILACLAGAGLAFELGMTWVELVVIEAVCPYCVTALGLIAATFAAALVAWRASQGEARQEGRHT